MPKLSINGKSIEADRNQTLFDLVESMSIKVPSSCKKQGTCKECIFEIKEGADLLSPMTKEEQHLTARYRLTCQAHIIEEGEVVMEELKRTIIRIEDKGIADFGKIIIDSPIQREGENVTLNGKIIAQTSGSLLGLAVDIGTTTVVVRLIDIEEGKIKASAAFENPQRFAGSNVMARIVYDTEHGKKELKRVFTAHLANTILSFCDEPENIFEVVVGGNTTMRDLFFGINVHSIGQTPYHSLTEMDVANGAKSSTALENNARKMQLPICPKARVSSLPIIGGHVGADTAAGLVAIGLMNEEKVIAFMDIGTNTEIVVGNKHKALVASSPSGPAFEGGGIACGMPALMGAVESVHITEDDKVVFKTVGDEKPVGICGSGLIDLLGELSRTEKMNLLGRMEDEEDKFIIDEENMIFINENDINLLAQTKAANVAALNILTKEYGIAFNDIDTFYLAGGFGEHIDIEAAIRIGLLPNIDIKKYKKIGNATIEGLTIALLSNKKRQELEILVKNMTQVSLESDPNFFDYFVDGCMFQKMNE